MNREDIIRMARDAGAELAELPMGDAWLFTDDKCLERFAALVASAEREACAKICEENWHECGGQCANVIRYGGNHD